MSAVVAHEEQGEGVVPIHGGIGVGGGTKAHSAQTSLATASSRRRRATSLRTWSVSRRKRDVVEPAAGIAGQSLLRPSARGRDQRLLHRIFRRAEVVTPPRDGAEHLRRQLAQQEFDAAAGLRARHTSGGPLITCRTSTGMMSAARPGRGGRLRGDLVGALGAVHLHDPEPGEELLGLGERLVGHGRRSVLLRAHHPRLPGGVSPLTGDELPRLGEPLVEPSHEVDVRLEVLGAQSLTL